MQLTSIDGVRCVVEVAGDGVKCVVEAAASAGTGFLLKSFFMGTDSLNLGFGSLGSGLCSGLCSGSCSGSCLIMMGLVPCATPQTFSRMVVLPALALPMTRMRK